MDSDKKWIYLSYLVTTALVAWVVNQAATIVLSYLRVPNPAFFGIRDISASALGSLLLVGGYAYYYFGQEKVKTFSAEVMQELHKVTWPTRKNAYLSTVVVLVCVVIAAVILGVFDWVCASVIKLVL